MFYPGIVAFCIFFLLTISRLEDNILVTQTGYENLTTVPKTAAEVEALVG